MIYIDCGQIYEILFWVHQAAILFVFKGDASIVVRPLVRGDGETPPHLKPRRAAGKAAADALRRHFLQKWSPDVPRRKVENEPDDVVLSLRLFFFLSQNVDVLIQSN